MSAAHGNRSHSSDHRRSELAQRGEQNDPGNFTRHKAARPTRAPQAHRSLIRDVPNRCQPVRRGPRGSVAQVCELGSRRWISRDQTRGIGRRQSLAAPFPSLLPGPCKKRTQARTKRVVRRGMRLRTEDGQKIRLPRFGASGASFCFAPAARARVSSALAHRREWSDATCDVKRSAGHSFSTNRGALDGSWIKGC